MKGRGEIIRRCVYVYIYDREKIDIHREREI